MLVWQKIVYEKEEIIVLNGLTIECSKYDADAIDENQRK